MKEQQHSLMSGLGAPNRRICSMRIQHGRNRRCRATLSLVWVRCEGQVQEVGLRAQSDSLQVLHLNYFGDTALSLVYLLAFLCFLRCNCVSVWVRRKKVK